MLETGCRLLTTTNKRTEIVVWFVVLIYQFIPVCVCVRVFGKKWSWFVKMSIVLFLRKLNCIENQATQAGSWVNDHAFLNSSKDATHTDLSAFWNRTKKMDSWTIPFIEHVCYSVRCVCDDAKSVRILITLMVCQSTITLLLLCVYGYCSFDEGIGEAFHFATRRRKKRKQCVDANWKIA